MKKSLSILAVLLSSGLFADAPYHPNLPVDRSPWFTGPLLTPSAYVVKSGHVNFEPYVYATAFVGAYTSDWKAVSAPHVNWAIVTQSYLQIGLTPWLEVQLVPSTTHNIVQGASSFQVGDFPVELQFQLYTPGKGDWTPAVKFSIQETFPTGKYDELNPSLNRADVAGSGTYETEISLTLGHSYHIAGDYFSTLRVQGSYIIPTRAHIRGLNTYGGAINTDGYVYPGQSYQIFLGWEISLARHWSFAIDGFADIQARNTFKGDPGSVSAASLEGGSSASYSLAPAIEWNWGQNIGLISGVWFTFAGRNASQFISWVTALNYYY